MNEFIVWDKLSTRFGFGKVIQVKLNGNLYVEFKDENGKEFYKYRTPKDIEILNYIGLNDISDTKVYAKSSIIQFRDNEDLGYGYFIYDNKQLRYEIKTLSKIDIYNGITLPYVPCIMVNIKVVDTIQENKLGLIK